MKKFVVILLTISLLAAIAFIGRFHLLVYGMYLYGAPELEAPLDEGPDTRWYDDYYTIHTIDSRTFAIGETRYWQYNFNYLIVGDQRAILFDAGPGVRDIRPVVRSLTDLPVTFIPSHLHYDHVGNQEYVERVALIDLRYLRERARDGFLTLTLLEHLGLSERIEAPTIKIDEWLDPGSKIALGERDIDVVFTPGHTRDGVSLLDANSGYVFSGDFLVPGSLAELLPRGGMGDYLQGVETLLRVAPIKARVFGAHRPIFDAKSMAPEGVSDTPRGVPELTMDDVASVREALLSIRDGKLAGIGPYPVVYPINDRLELWANPPWLQDWTPRHL